MTVTSEVDFVVKDAISKLVAKGVPLMNAANMVGGLSKRAVDAMMRDDPDFRDSITDAHARMIGEVDRTAFEEAVDGNSKWAELFYRRHVPEMMLPQAQRQGAAPAIQIANVTVLAVQQLITGEHAPEFLSLMHGNREILEAEVVEDGSDQADVDPS